LERVLSVKQSAGNGIGRGTPGPGRPKGIPNKATRQAKEAIALAAEGLGGTERLIAWAKESPDNEKAFWTSIYPRLVPLDVHGSHDVNIVDRAELRRRAEEEVRSVFGRGSDGIGLGDHGGGLPH
jgi:hypothetical protein